MKKKGIIAISPLIVFVFLYLVTSIVAGDFYKVPITVAFMIASIYAVVIGGGIPLSRRIDIFSRGASTSNMMLMIWIFILAGAFANTAKVMGCVDATINLTLTLLPANMLLAGLFLAACFISLSIGTSVGTIVALTPIAAGSAESLGMSVPMMTAVIVGGSFFGDNLSFIPDTTITATSTQGCKLSDKFRVNAFLAFPAAFLVLCLYAFMGSGITSDYNPQNIDIIKVMPYIIVLLTALFGMNVTAVLTLGIILTGVIGMCSGCFDVYGWFKAMGDGIIGMGELVIVTMMAAGMLELIKERGGIDFIIKVLTRHVNGKRGAELCIATLVAVVNVCTANNTVAILTVGQLSKKIGDRFGVDNRKCASILDTMSCCVQGVIPYGAQLLMAAGLAEINPISIMPYLYYPLTIGIITILAILLRYPRRYS
ncbi:Na+/H+ antiporter NhaC family protein [Prevotella sp. P2-180]|uniref:Na+/H+ antiporter NhaC family protein n=1 Tax=Prevotella sp. P2-180 TaxID=2024224 RepID=UPI000B97C231|nr:Na+/H+ antiporter NhaC family protein [Prevotella sp. P2-180]OYP69054.1 sodium:proton antiporter [Prevotella sp. P2-180]